MTVPLRPVSLADPSTDTTLVPIRIAAEQLGLSRHAVRQRIRRGTLHAVCRDGRWFVALDSVHTRVSAGAGPRTPPRTDTRTPPWRDTAEGSREGEADTTDDLHQLVGTLQAENTRLWHELDVRTEELRRKDTIIMQLAGRPMIAAATPMSDSPPSPTDHAPAPATAAEMPRRATDSVENPSARRPWWRRWFGG
jgi:hypothetical protein